MCGKGSGRHNVEKTKAGFGGVEATLARKELRGEVYFLDKGLFMGTTRKRAVQQEKQNREEERGTTVNNDP
jgi:hypothetical protein